MNNDISQNLGMEKMPFMDAEIELKNLNKFETLLRNTVINYQERKSKIDFEFFFKMLDETFSHSYWKQLALILLYYAALNVNEIQIKEDIMKRLQPIYQYFITLYENKN